MTGVSVKKSDEEDDERMRKKGGGGGMWLGPDLVVTTVCDVADPRHGLVAALFDDLEVADLDARDGEVGDFKLDADGTLDLRGVLGRDGREIKVCAGEVLLAAGEHLDGPDHLAVLGLVLAGADGGLEAGAVGVDGDGDHDPDVVGGALEAELAAGLDEELDAAVLVLVDDGLDPDERLDARVEAVGHELEVAVGRHKADRVVGVEARETDALVEVDVLHLDRLAHRRRAAAAGAGVVARAVDLHLVVEAETQLGHAAQLAAHLDGAEDLAAQHLARRAHQQVHALHHVEEHLVLGVVDALWTPVDCTSHCLQNRCCLL